jgi:hypothetical protein
MSIYIECSFTLQYLFFIVEKKKKEIVIELYKFRRCIFTVKFKYSLIVYLLLQVTLVCRTAKKSNFNLKERKRERKSENKCDK